MKSVLVAHSLIKSRSTTAPNMTLGRQLSDSKAANSVTAEFQTQPFIQVGEWDLRSCSLRMLRS
jgi:hypothetical protein